VSGGGRNPAPNTSKDFMQKCDICETEGHYRLRAIGNGVWSCMGCLRTPPSELSVGIQTKIKVGNLWATQSQLNEMDRRVIIPGTLTKDGSYKIGRRMENGRISENQVPRYAS